MFHLQIFQAHLYHQFHEYLHEIQRGNREGPVNKWDLWQIERTFPKRIFPMEIFQNFLYMENALSFDLPGFVTLGVSSPVTTTSMLSWVNY